MKAWIRDARPRYDEATPEVQNARAPDTMTRASLDPALSLLILQPELAFEFEVEAFECLTRGDQDQIASGHCLGRACRKLELSG